MQNREPAPPTITDLPGQPLGVRVDTQAKDEGDSIATLALLNLYTQQDGFHCPRCGVIIKKPEEAINHLAEEINKSLASLGK
ncbi:hypothetical protein ES705_29640 [subsurface metagenome]